MFIDKAKIFVKGGDGGHGIVAFRREKYVPYGGPSGGDGGKGGNIIFKVDSGFKTLMDFKYQPHMKANRGQHGSGDNKHGKSGEDLIINVPQGTVVKDAETGEVIFDLVQNQDKQVIAKGGRGGRGNARFASNKNKAPKEAESGGAGEERWLILELKVLADVGLVGFPNAGKSTLLSRVSGAKPKVAGYPFTTITPNLGVIEADYDSRFVMADIPGLIPGAHEGKGLGDEFLKHVERTNLLVHLVDTAGTEGRDPVDDVETINQELTKYGNHVGKKHQILAANKMDLGEVSHDNLERLKKQYGEAIEIYPISAVTGSGISELLYAVQSKLTELEQMEEQTGEKEPEEPELEKVYSFHEDNTEKHITADQDKEYPEIDKREDVFIVKDRRLSKFIETLNFNKEEDIRKFQDKIDELGIEKLLKEKGIQNGDTVKIDDIEFEFFA